jgi:predicted transcriptional regulator
MRVKQLKGSIKLLESLSPRALDILQKLGAGNPATIVAEACSCSKANITYWKNKLLDMGALKLQTNDVIKIYSLTTYGLKVLTRSERVCVEPVVLEDHAVKFGVVECERVRLDWVKLGQPRNWEKLGVRIGSVRVERTSRSIIIHPGRLKGFDVDELEVDAGRIVERVKVVLENRFGMVLGDEGTPLHKPIYRFYSEEAKEDVKHGTCIIEGKSSTDESPPEREAHEEYNGKERAKARQLLPDSVKRLEMKVDSLVKTAESLVVSTSRLVDLLKGALETPSQDTKMDNTYVR